MKAKKTAKKTAKKRTPKHQVNVDLGPVYGPLIAKMSDHVNMPKTQIARYSIEAMIRAWQKTGKFESPFRIVWGEKQDS